MLRTYFADASQMLRRWLHCLNTKDIQVHTEPRCIETKRGLRSCFDPWPPPSLKTDPWRQISPQGKESTFESMSMAIHRYPSTIVCWFCWPTLRTLHSLHYICPYTLYTILNGECILCTKLIHWNQYILIHCQDINTHFILVSFSFHCHYSHFSFLQPFFEPRLTKRLLLTRLLRPNSSAQTSRTHLGLLLGLRTLLGLKYATRHSIIWFHWLNT